jgi:hypothetical protein
MTVTELYEKYAEGKITRGAFIRRMVGFGMTAGLAAAYADAIAKPALAASRLTPGTDYYEDFYEEYYGDYGPYGTDALEDLYENEGDDQGQNNNDQGQNNN